MAWRTLSLLLLIASFFLALPAAADAPDSGARVVRVGIYENPPKIFTDTAGRPSGIFGDLITAIAAREGWNLVVVPGSWEECLARLKAGKIDVMVDVAWSEERAAQFDFNRDVVLSNWGRVYTRPGAGLESLLDLAGKRVAVMQGSLHTSGKEGIVELARRLDIRCTFLPCADYHAVMAAVRDGQAEAGVVNRVFGDEFEDDYGLHRTAIIFNPNNAHFAFTKGDSDTPYLIDRIDRNLRAMKADEQSPYFQTLERHLGSAVYRRVETWPAWATKLIVLLVALALLFLGFNVLLKREVDRAVAQVRESEERFRTIYDSVNDAIFVHDAATGAILDVNQRTCELYGYSRAEILARDSGALSAGEPPYDQATALERMRQAAAGTPQVFEWQARSKAGEVFPIEVGIRRAVLGGQARLLVTARDIRERKSAEAEIRALNAALEQRVIERTAELSAANHDLESFAYSVSHDLRAPLRSIDGFSKALIEDYGDKIDAEGQDFLNRVRAEAQRMGALIDDMLKLARVVRTELRRESVDITTLAREVEAALRQAAPERRVEVAIQEGMTAEADAQLVRIALTNLMGNAWKFTARRADARIEVGAVQEQGVTPVFYVKDNGAGFDMAYAKKLFTPFERLHTDKEFAGSGIGLATVQRVVSRHGGRVWAEGAVGRGATFFWTLAAFKTIGGEA